MFYRLSPCYQLKKLGYLKKELSKEELASLEEQDTFVLVKDQRRSYLINWQIYRFLKFLRKPQSKAAIDKKFADLDWYPFFKQLLRRGILVDTEKWNPDTFPDEQAAFLRFAIGDKVEGYQIEKLLAYRNYTQTGIVKKNKAQAVIKALSLPPTLPIKKRKKLMDQFGQEFELMQQLPAHPHLSQLLSYHPKEHYAFLKWIKGKTLDKVIRKKTLTNKAKEKIIFQIVTALSFLHQHQIVHGDLHHRNVMVSKDHQVTLLDFGLSHAARQHTSTTQKMGGLDLYLPPERITKSSFRALVQPATFQSDIYQLGILLYYLIFEQFPFTGFTWDVLYEAIQQGKPTYVLDGKNRLKKYIPIIKKCLHRNLDKRFENGLSLLMYLKTKL